MLFSPAPTLLRACCSGGADTMLEVVAAVVRRVGMSPKFNARDFELVLSRPLSGEDLRFSLPSTIVKGAESTKAAAERLAGDTLGMKGEPPEQLP